MQAKPDFILPLSDTSAGLPQVGGKGASLARLAAAGLPVPDGFHVTTAAYRTIRGRQPPGSGNHCCAGNNRLLPSLPRSKPHPAHPDSFSTAGQMPDAIAADDSPLPIPTW